jgi:seryl-tRNA synthetase
VIDLALIRSQPELVRELVRRRGADVDVDRLFEVDRQLRQTLAELNERQRERRNLGADADRERARALRDQVDELERRAATLQAERDALWARLPNLLAPDTPDGEDDSDNVELRRWGDPPSLAFEPKTHDLIGARLGILDLERGAVVAGAGFYYWRGDGARLAWGLFSLALDFLVERGFTPMLTPVVARERTLFGTGYLPFFADQIYRLEDVDLSLIGTSEQTLVGCHADEILPTEQLPLRYTAMTPCFRTEAGSGGRAARGAFRVHQFHKVEQIVFCAPDESERWHLHCLENEELFMQRLGIPYRVVRVCIGDLGAPAYKKYDVEGWFAGFGEFRETHSNTNLLDYQTRRLNARYKDGKRTVFPHTISATMITDRALLAILENGQQADGSVVVPEALRPYVDGKERLSPTG